METSYAKPGCTPTDEILQALQNQPGKDVVLYCAASICATIITELAKYNITPLCICDGNSKLWGTTFCEVEVMSIEAANKHFKNFVIYIATKQYLFDIIYELESKGINKDCIINYVAVKKSRSCYYLTNICISTTGQLVFCCGSGQSRPNIQIGDNVEESIADFIALRSKLLYDFENNINNVCDGCACLKETCLPVDFQYFGEVNIINMGSKKICNFKCCYCAPQTNYNSTKFDGITDIIKIIDVLKYKGLISPMTHFSWSCGEITVTPDREKIYEYCSNFFSQSTFLTNAFVFDEKISRLLEAGKTTIVVSVDAGTKETFSKIKGVNINAYEKVCNTLKKYAHTSNNSIKLKYIVLSGLNDNDEDIFGFVKLAREIHAIEVQISSDYYASNLTNQAMQAGVLLRDKCIEYKLFYKSVSGDFSKLFNERNYLKMRNNS